jgi:proteasome lid subunit RPN8/RPN11
MRLAIFSTVAEQIRAHARRDHPREACGLLLGRAGRIEAAVEAPNVAADPAHAFEIDPAVLLRCHREARQGGRELLGWYHSHPNGREEPSAADVARAVEDGKVWLIVAQGRLRAFRSAARRFEEVELGLEPQDRHDVASG